MITPNLFAPADPLQLEGPRLELRLPSRWIFRLPKPLQSPNRFIWRSRWALAAEREKWERELEVAVLTFSLVTPMSTHAAVLSAHAQLRNAQEKRAVRIWRCVPSARNFFHDDDNRTFSKKHLLDAMVSVGLLHDDSRAWLECAAPEEVVSEDGGWHTVIQLDARPDVRAAWRA